MSMVSRRGRGIVVGVGVRAGASDGASGGVGTRGLRIRLDLDTVRRCCMVGEGGGDEHAAAPRPSRTRPLPESPDPPVRAGRPGDGQVPRSGAPDALVGRCAVELTSGCPRHADLAITRCCRTARRRGLRRELDRETAPGALPGAAHLPKIGDRSAAVGLPGCCAILTGEVARKTAWRPAAAFWSPDDARRALAVVSYRSTRPGTGPPVEPESFTDRAGPVLDEVPAPVAGSRGSSAVVHATVPRCFHAWTRSRDRLRCRFHDARLLVVP